MALPRRETTKNFVLQTACRCLREVVSAKDETALIALGEGNYETLDRELKENYALSIADLCIHGEQAINVLIRKPRLGRVCFKNVRRRYSIIREARDGDVAAQLATFDFGVFKTHYPFTPTTTEATVGRRGLANAVTHLLDGIRRTSAFLHRFRGRTGPRLMGPILGSRPEPDTRRGVARHSFTD